MSSAIHFSRPLQFVGVVRRFRVEIDGVPHSMLAAGRKVVADVSPGEHFIRIQFGKYQISRRVVVDIGQNLRVEVFFGRTGLGSMALFGLIGAKQRRREIFQKSRTEEGFLCMRIKL